MAQIHPTALVDPRAELDDSVSIGPYAVIGPEVRIGAGTSVGPHCVIEGRTTIGRDNRFFQFSSIGAMPQDIWQDANHRGEVTPRAVRGRAPPSNAPPIDCRRFQHLAETTPAGRAASAVGWCSRRSGESFSNCWG